MYNTRDIERRIEECLKRKKLQKKQLLDDLGMGINALSQFAKGKELSCITFAKIADYLSCSVDYLLGRTNERNINNMDNNYNYDFTNMSNAQLNLLKLRLYQLLFVKTGENFFVNSDITKITNSNSQTIRNWFKDPSSIVLNDKIDFIIEYIGFEKAKLFDGMNVVIKTKTAENLGLDVQDVKSDIVIKSGAELYHIFNDKTWKQIQEIDDSLASELSIRSKIASNKNVSAVDHYYSKIAADSEKEQNSGNVDTKPNKKILEDSNQ